MRISYIVIPLITAAVAVVGSMFTSGGLSSWYGSIAKPSWTPPGSVIGMVWTTIFILSAIAAIMVWQMAPRDGRFYWTIGLLLLNAILNILWSYLFFEGHMIGAAVIEAALLDITVWVLIALIWSFSRTAAILLLPYGLWAAFATYLTFAVWRLNA